MNGLRFGVARRWVALVRGVGQRERVDPRSLVLVGVNLAFTALGSGLLAAVFITFWRVCPFPGPSIPSFRCFDIDVVVICTDPFACFPNLQQRAGWTRGTLRGGASVTSCGTA